MRILGIDPGLATVGYGVVESRIGNDFTALEYGAVLTEAGKKVDRFCSFKV